MKLVDTLCGALGTRLVALAWEWEGIYQNAFMGLIALTLLAALLVVSLKQEKDKAS